MKNKCNFIYSELAKYAHKASVFPGKISTLIPSVTRHTFLTAVTSYIMRQNNFNIFASALMRYTALVLGGNGCQGNASINNASLGA